MTLVMMIFAFSGPSSGKAQNRRLQGIRERNMPSVALAMESQLRKISANRGNSLDNFSQRFIPNPALLRQRLDRTGKNWTLGQYSRASLIVMVVLAVVLTVVGLPIFLALLVGIGAGLALPHLVVGSFIKRRLGKFNTNFPDAIELMVRGLRSGLPITETIGVVGNELTGPVAEEFRSVGDKIRIGRTMEQALQETADRLGIAEVQFFCITLAIQRETGGNLAETLANLAEVLRKRAQMKLKVKAMSSEAKASAYIIGALPFLVFIMIYMVNPNYMGKFFVDARLMMLGGGGLCWMGIGAYIMAKMIDFEI